MFVQIVQDHFASTGCIPILHKEAGTSCVISAIQAILPHTGREGKRDDRDANPQFLFALPPAFTSIHQPAGLKR